MSLTEFLFSHENYIFTSSIVLMLFIALLEGVMMLVGAGLSDMIDSLIPDLDADISLDMQENVFALSRIFSWLRFKKIPFLMLLVVFLTSFGIVGLLFQAVLFKLTTFLWSGWIVIIPSLMISILSLRIVGGWILNILPKDETTSISNDDLIGYIATIILGKATKGHPAEAKTKDNFGQTHYFMVEPEIENIEFKQGEEVLILGKIKEHYFATNQIPEKLK